jgi:hypothetical protein
MSNTIRNENAKARKFITPKTGLTSVEPARYEGVYMDNTHPPDKGCFHRELSQYPYKQPCRPQSIKKKSIISPSFMLFLSH